LHYDEGPSQEDLSRFSSDETGYCPNCGEDIYDDASQCPVCNSWLSEGVSHQDLVSKAFRKKFLVMIVIVILIGFFWSVRYLF
jgi:predicted amidophosphoribosyltransferase